MIPFNSDPLRANRGLTRSTKAVLVRLELQATERSGKASLAFLGFSLAYRYAIMSFDKLGLTARLTGTCATFCSDEYAIRDDRGLTRPHPRELGICPSGGAFHRRLRCEEHGTKMRKESPDLVLIVGLHRELAARGELETPAQGQAMPRPHGTRTGRSWARDTSAARGPANETADVLVAMLSP